VRWVWQLNWTHLGRHQTRPLGGAAGRRSAKWGGWKCLTSKSKRKQCKWSCKRDGISLLSCGSLCSCLFRRCLVLNFTRISALPSSSHSFYAPPQPRFSRKNSNSSWHSYIYLLHLLTPPSVSSLASTRHGPVLVLPIAHTQNFDFWVTSSSLPPSLTQVHTLQLISCPRPQPPRPWAP